MPRKKKTAPAPEPSTALVAVENEDMGALADRLTGDAPAPEPPPDPNPPIDAEFHVVPDGDHELLQKICKAEREVQELETVWDARKEDAKEAKDRFDEGVLRLRHLIQSAGDEDSMPLFPQNGHAGANGQAAPTATDADVEDESWKYVPLGQALEGITEAVLQKLLEAELETVGDLQAFIERVGQNGYSDPLSTIKGIGAATAQKIADALEKFWERRRA